MQTTTLAPSPATTVTQSDDVDLDLSLSILLDSASSSSASASLSMMWDSLAVCSCLPTQIAIVLSLCLSHCLFCRMFFCTHNQVTVEEAYVTGQRVMGRANKRLGKLLSGSPEDLRFRAFFGVSAQVGVTAWSMMEDHSVLPTNPKFVHFLWALAFMRTYPANDTTLSCLLGGSDPKTIGKYVWPLIRSLYVLNETVVSICLIVALVDSSLTFQ